VHGYASQPMAAVEPEGAAPAPTAPAPKGAAPAPSAAPSPSEWFGHLLRAWDAEISPSIRRVLLALGALVFVAAALVARIGTAKARLGAAALFAVLLATVVVRVIAVRRRRTDPRRIIAATVGRADPALGAATLRALGLVERTARSDDAGSPVLAALHLRRMLERAPIDRMRARAAGLATGWSVAGIALAGTALALVVAEPFRVVEGIDVLAARHGEAPVPLFWLDDVSMTGMPPAYLHEPEELLTPFSPVALPRGTKIAVRGSVMHPGRQLLLTDGRAEVPFIGDGDGGVVAHFPLADSARLRVVAAFGDVRVPQADVQMVTSIDDELPVVRLEGAPRTVRILDEPTIHFTYEATDDHGLREIVLSLRTGLREERRILSKPGTDARSDKGSYQLSANDPFFRKTYAPVEARVEARDNDEVSGPKWGKSEALIVVLPQAGEPEALRYAELVKARDRMTDLLAGRITHKVDPKKTKELVTAETDAQREARKVTMEALSKTFGGLKPNSRMTALARGQWSRLDKSLDAFAKAPSAATYEKLMHDTEDALLAFDGGVRALGSRDTRAVAKRLADVADEAALAAGALALSMDTASATIRLDASFGVLDAGGKQMLKLGDLGVDLGEIVANDLRRIDRARTASDFKHAELAAQDLAARLRKPDPSFVGGSGQGGGESGGSPSVDPKEASDADAEQAANEQDLEDLARDHATEMNEVSEAMERAESEERQALKEAAREHAKAIRDAVKDLPKQGRPQTSEAEAAAGRQEAEGMAGSLDGANLQEAVDRGREALKALKEAKRLGGDSGFFEDSTGKRAGEAADALEKELKWAEESLDKLRQAARERAKEDLSRSGKDEEKLSQRARDLSEKARQGDRALDESTLDRLGEAERAMRDAQRALQEGDGEKGKKHQEIAQRALEMAQNRRDEEGERPHGDREDADARPLGGKAEIPGKDKFKGPEAFRKRVMEGLSGPVDPALKEAVKRYAEGLLK
jgi:hypothetical protein